jgi:hypothetical protein
MTFNEKLRSFAFWLHFRSHQERFSFPPSDAGLASRRASHAPPARPCVGRQLREGDPEAGPAPGARGRNSGARVGPDARRAFTREGPDPAAGASPRLRAPRGDVRPRPRRLEAPATRAPPRDRRRAARRRFSASSAPERTCQALRRARNVRPASPRSCALTIDAISEFFAPS